MVETETEARPAVEQRPSGQDTVNSELEPGIFLPAGRQGRVFNDHLFGLFCITAFLLLVIIIGWSRLR